MPLRVLGSVEKQPEHRRGQLETPDSAGGEQRRLQRAAELLESSADLLLESRRELGGLRRRSSRGRFRVEKDSLLRRESFSSRIGEQPVQTARRMTDVKPYRSSPTGTSPEIRGRKRSYDGTHFLQGLEKRMGHRL